MQRDTIEVLLSEAAQFSLGPDTAMSVGATIELSVDNQSLIPLWSTGSTEHSIDVHIPGTYWVQVRDSLGCVKFDTILVDVISGVSKELPEHSKRNLILPGETGFYGLYDALKINPGNRHLSVFDLMGIQVYGNPGLSKRSKPGIYSGLYYYVLKGSGRHETLTGYVHLVK